MSIHRNTAYNLLGSILPLTVSIVTIPAYLSLIGEVRYGMLAIIWVLLGYFGVFDLGLSRATAQQVAIRYNENPAKAAQIFWTALQINSGLGLVGGLLIWPAAYFTAEYMEMGDNIHREFLSAIPWLIVAVPMATVTGVLSGALQGRELFWEVNSVAIAGTVLFQIIPLVVAAFFSVDLGILVPSAIFARSLTLLALWLLCRRHIFGGHPLARDAKATRYLLRFGGWVTVSALVGPLMVVLDRFVIGALIGGRAVSYYTVPFQLAERSTMVARAFGSALFPRFAYGTPVESKQLLVRSFRQLMIVMTPLTLIGIYLLPAFLGWWLDPDFAEKASAPGQILLLGFWLNSLARLPLAHLQAAGRPDLIAKCHLAELIPYLAILSVGLHYFGLEGSAAAFTLRAALDFFLLASLAGVRFDEYKLMIFPGITLFTAWWISSQLNPTWSVWMALFCIQLGTTGVWTWRFISTYYSTTAKKILQSVVEIVSVRR